MATYQQIQDYVRRNNGFTPKTCWIAHVKDELGLPMRKASNRLGAERKYPCPEDKKSEIEAALRHFGMIDFDRLLG